MRSITEILFSKKTRAQVFEPLFADMQEEYYEKLAEKKSKAAACIKYRYRLIFITTIAAQVPVSVTRILFALWKAAS